MTSPHLLIPTATPAATKSLATSVATKATTTSAQPGATSTTIVVHVPKVPTAARTTSPNARALPDHVTAQRVRDMARKSDAEKARTARLERARVREMWRGVFKVGGGTFQALSMLAFCSWSLAEGAREEGEFDGVDSW